MDFFMDEIDHVTKEMAEEMTKRPEAILEKTRAVGKTEVEIPFSSLVKKEPTMPFPGGFLG